MTARLGDVIYWASLCGVVYLAALFLQYKDVAYTQGALFVLAFGCAVRYVLTGKGPT